MDGGLRIFKLVYKVLVGLRRLSARRRHHGILNALGSAQDPIKGTSTLDNPNASHFVPALILKIRYMLIEIFKACD